MNLKLYFGIYLIILFSVPVKAFNISVEINKDSVISNVIYIDSTETYSRNGLGIMDSTKKVFTSWDKTGLGLGYTYYTRMNGIWQETSRLEYDNSDPDKHIQINSIWNTTKNAFEYTTKREIDVDSVSPNYNKEFIWDNESNVWILDSYTESQFKEFNKSTNHYSFKVNPATQTIDTIRKKQCIYEAGYTNCSVSVWDSENEKWGLILVDESGVDDNGISYTLYKSLNETSGAWRGSKTENKIDEFGNTILTVSYEWNGEKESWRGVGGKYVYVYNEQKTDKEQTKYIWNEESNQWINDEKRVYTYNSNKDLTYEATYNYDQLRQVWIGNTKKETEYDTNFNIISQIDYSWNSTTLDWENYEKRTFEYNASQEQTLTSLYKWDVNNKIWVNVQKTYYEYDAYDNTILILYYFKDESSESLHLEFKDVYELSLNQDGEILQEIQNRVFEDHTAPIHKKINVLYPNNSLKAQTTYLWNPSLVDWEAASLHEFKYDLNGEESSHKYSYYNTNTQKWIGSTFYEVLYDPVTQQKNYIRYSWDYSTESWITQYYDTITIIPMQYEYVAQYGWNSGTGNLVGTHKHEIKSINGKTTDVVYYTWDNLTNTWKYLNIVELKYYDTTYLVTQATYSQTLYPENTFGIQSQIKNYYSKHDIVTSITDPKTEEVVDNNNFLIYPNPAENLLYLQEKDIVISKIYDLTGREIGAYNDNVLDISQLIKGIYLIAIHSEKGIKTMRFIKN